MSPGVPGPANPRTAGKFAHSTSGQISRPPRFVILQRLDLFQHFLTLYANIAGRLKTRAFARRHKFCPIQKFHVALDFDAFFPWREIGLVGTSYNRNSLAGGSVHMLTSARRVFPDSSWVQLPGGSK